MKFAWILTLVVGLGLLLVGMTVQGAGGAVLMLLGMVSAFSTALMFVLGEYEPQQIAD